MRNQLVLLWMFICSAAPTWAQVGVHIGLPSIDIGIHLPLYPELMPVPGYPVYYAPQLNSNYFFYDGMYWVFQDNNWYASNWYNGPWRLVDQEVVPVFVLRIPVRYYRQSPVYFRGWSPDAAPHWGEHWGDDWQQRHHGWDKWNRSTPAVRPPLPVYQRNYTGDRYPQLREQQILQNKNYRYQPHDPLVRQQVQELRKHVTSMPTPIKPMPDQSRQQVRKRKILAYVMCGRIIELIRPNLPNHKHNHNASRYKNRISVSKQCKYSALKIHNKIKPRHKNQIVRRCQSASKNVNDPVKV